MAHKVSLGNKGELKLLGTQSVYRAIRLLQAVGEHCEKGISMSALARKLGLHTATTHRILTALSAEGLLSYDPLSKLYYLGMEIFRLGAKVRHFAVRNRYRWLLENAAAETGNTAFLLMRLGNDCICIDRVVGNYPIRTLTVEIGTQRPLGIGSGSLSLMAFLPDEEIEGILNANARRYPRYGVDSEQLRSLILKGRTNGFVESICLFHEAVNSVGIPLFDEAGNIEAAVSVGGIPQRMDHERLTEIAELLKKLSMEERLTVLGPAPKTLTAGA